jgi:hypothetical protein
MIFIWMLQPRTQGFCAYCSQKPWDNPNWNTKEHWCHRKRKWTAASAKNADWAYFYTRSENALFVAIYDTFWLVKTTDYFWLYYANLFTLLAILAYLQIKNSPFLLFLLSNQPRIWFKKVFSSKNPHLSIVYTLCDSSHVAKYHLVNE